MSEVQEDYRVNLAWARPARDIENMIMADGDRDFGDVILSATDTLHRAADLLALAEWVTRGGCFQIWVNKSGLHVDIGRGKEGITLAGPNAIAEAAAFVRGQR